MRTGGYLTSQKKKSIWFAHNGGFYRSWPLSAFLAKTRPVCSYRFVRTSGFPGEQNSSGPAVATDLMSNIKANIFSTHASNDRFLYSAKVPCATPAKFSEPGWTL